MFEKAERVRVLRLEAPPEEAAQDEKLRPIGLAAGEFTVPDDFDDPLPEEILRLFEGGEE